MRFFFFLSQKGRQEERKRWTERNWYFTLTRTVRLYHLVNSVFETRSEPWTPGGSWGREYSLLRYHNQPQRGMLAISFHFPFVKMVAGFFLNGKSTQQCLSGSALTHNQTAQPVVGFQTNNAWHRLRTQACCIMPTCLFITVNKMETLRPSG